MLQPPVATSLIECNWLCILGGKDGIISSLLISMGLTTVVICKVMCMEAVMAELYLVSEEASCSPHTPCL